MTERRTVDGHDDDELRGAMAHLVVRLRTLADQLHWVARQLEDLLRRDDGRL